MQTLINLPDEYENLLSGYTAEELGLLLIQAISNQQAPKACPELLTILKYSRESSIVQYDMFDLLMEKLDSISGQVSTMSRPMPKMVQRSVAPAEPIEFTDIERPVIDLSKAIDSPESADLNMDDFLKGILQIGVV